MTDKKVGAVRLTKPLHKIKFQNFAKHICLEYFWI